MTDWRRRQRSKPGVALLALALPMVVAMAPSGADPLVDVIVRSDSASNAIAAIEAVGGRTTFPLPIIDGAAGSLPARSLDRLRRMESVREVDLNEEISFQHSNGGYSDSKTPRSVFADEIRAKKLWEEGITGKGVRVALIDTGISAVPDLEGRVVSVPDPRDPQGRAACVNFSGEPGCGDSYGHGTFIAGLIAGNGSQSKGDFKGSAPDAELVSLKIAGMDGSADVTKVLAAIQWVVSFRQELGIKVLNLSLGTNSPVTYRIDPLNLAVERAWRSGITVVVSASNRGPGPGTISKPGDDPLVLTTGAVDDRETSFIWDDRLPAFSGRGPTAADGLSKPDVVAPGAKVISLRSPGSTVERLAPGGGIDETYRRGSGTSMSAGILSGSVALVLQANPAWTPDRVKFAFMATSRKVASADVQHIGAGLIDAYAAAKNAPAGLANQNVSVLSDGTGSLDGSRGDVLVSSMCGSLESSVAPRRCDLVEGTETAQGRMFNSDAYREADWTGSSWYSSQWNSMLGSSWYGSSWYGSSWYGSSWYGSSWYGWNEEETSYGISIMGSSWYGTWE